MAANFFFLAKNIILAILVEDNYRTFPVKYHSISFHLKKTDKPPGGGDFLTQGNNLNKLGRGT